MTRVSWITNLAAPYRIPVWNILGERVDLEVKTIVTKKYFSIDGRGRSADWATHDDSHNYNQKTLRSVRFPWINYPVNIITSINDLKDLVRSDVIVLSGWNDPLYWQVLILAKIFRKSTVGFYESILATQRNKRGVFSVLRSFFFRSLDSVVTPGIAATDAILAMGVSPAKVFQGFNAVDVQRFAAPKVSSKEAESIGHRFIFVGRLIQLKRVDDIIKAFAISARPGDVLTIIGGGECKLTLVELVDSLGLSDRITFYGEVAYDSLPEELINHNTLVLASSTEVWGLVVNEALASGLHVVVSDNCGVAPSVQDMEGVFITDKRVEDLAEAMSLSRSKWTGSIPDPEILSYGPAEFAECFLKAFGSDLGCKS